jgi:hypothetical protein
MRFFLSHFCKVAPPVKLPSMLSDRPQPSQPDKLTQSKMDHLFLGSGSRKLHGLAQKLLVQVNIGMGHKLPSFNNAQI